MDEVTDPSLTVFVEGFLYGGLKLHILNKIRDTCLVVGSVQPNTAGESNNTLVRGLSQIQSTSFLNSRFTRFNLQNSWTKNFTRLCSPVDSLSIAYAIRKSTPGLNRSFHTKVKARNRIGPHNEDVISVLVGSLLGDCYANSRTIEGTRFCFRQSQVHKDYLF